MSDNLPDPQNPNQYKKKPKHEPNTKPGPYSREKSRAKYIDADPGHKAGARELGIVDLDTNQDLGLSRYEESVDDREIQRIRRRAGLDDTHE